MTTYTLQYFPITALGEPIRFLLAYGGIQYEDKRVAREDWPANKPNMPFGQMPVLDINGKRKHQTLAICRYLAKQVKLNGKNDLEDLDIDAAVDTVNDLRQKIGLYHYESDQAIKASRKAPLFNETLPYYLERLDAIAKENNGYLACGRLTWADIYLVSLLDYLELMAGQDIIAKYPNLVAVKNNVLNIPSIKKWVETRPASQF